MANSHNTSTTATSALTRRAALAGLATAAAVVPAAAVAAPSLAPRVTPELDPVFAAIDKHRVLEQEFIDAVTSENALEETLPKAALRDPRVRYGRFLGRGRSRNPLLPWHLYSHEDIDANIDQLTAIQKTRVVEKGSFSYLEKHRADLHRAFDRDATRQKQKQDATGWTAAQKRREAASDVADTAAMALAETPPTTIAGVAALLRYAHGYAKAGNQWPDVVEEDHLMNQGWTILMHRTVADALEKMRA